MKQKKNLKIALIGLFIFAGTSLSFGQTTLFSEAGGGAAPTDWTFKILMQLMILIGHPIGWLMLQPVKIS